MLQSEKRAGAKKYPYVVRSPQDTDIVRSDKAIDAPAYVQTKNLQEKQENISVDEMNGMEFEEYCVQLLKKLGFISVQRTPGSGDQGVDIIANKDDIKYAIQCKRYATPVGNNSVQQVVAGKKLYKCHVAVVLTNSSFTDSAKELARVNNCLLWDGAKLRKMQEQAREIA